MTSDAISATEGRDTELLVLGEGAAAKPRRRILGMPTGVKVLLCQVGLVVAFLAAWQYLPQIPALRAQFSLLDPFFISSPAQVWSTVTDMATGHEGSPLIWPYVWRTIEAALLGMLVGMVLGGAGGLLLSSSEFTSKVIYPFVTAVNATPRIAFVPLVVIMFGASRAASITISVLVVFFVAFFNAFEGGRTVPTQLLQNARLLGADGVRQMLRIRLPYVVAWCMASLPVALAFSLVSVVTAEVFTGYEGVGRLLMTATATVNADLTFGLVVYLAVMGVALVTGAEFLKRRLLHWWTAA